MSSASNWRFEWLKAVTQAENLLPAAKVIATALSVQFANDETRQIDPEVTTLADCVKTSVDTVKRAIRALVDAGWLGKTEGRGRGNRTSYTLLSPGKIISFSTQKKGGTSAPFHYKDKQSSEQRACATVSGVPPLPNFSPRIVYDHDTENIAEWNRWLAKNRMPPIQSLPIRTSDKGGTGYRMPLRYVPSAEDDQHKVRRYILWAVDQQEISYAAQ